MNVITPMKSPRTWINGLLFTIARAQPAVLSSLLRLSLIHFARWVIIRRHQWPDFGQGRETCIDNYMLFCSNFNGTWDQYIDAFSDGIPNGLDLFWYSSTKYPQSIPMSPFKNYIRHNQIDTSYYYNATPGAAQRDIKAALRVAGAIRRLAEAHAADDPKAFAVAVAYRRELTRVQTSLGSHGFAPSASEDTDTADRNREPFVEDAWGRPDQRRAA